MQYPETTLDISSKLDLPFQLVDSYTELLKEKKMSIFSSGGNKT